MTIKKRHEDCTPCAHMRDALTEAREAGTQFTEVRDPINGCWARDEDGAS